MSAAPPARFWVGPPPPPAFRYVTRALQAGVLLAMATWVFGYLGGLRLSPKPAADGASNDTSQLFNWHPLLLSLAFPVLMGEALLAYRCPLVPVADRTHSKLWHLVMHTAALACVVLGVVAAFKSHTLKRPTPMPNLYSSHSWLGVSVLCLLAVQYGLGVAAYLWPQWTLERRRALGPLHMFLGRAAFTAGLATMAAGVQEKQTFVQAYGKPASVYAGVMRLPAAIQVLLLLAGAAVLFHHVPPAAEAEPPYEAVSLVAADGARGSGEQQLAPRFSNEEDHQA